MNATTSALPRLLVLFSALAVALSPHAQEQQQPLRNAVTIVHSLGSDSETVGVNNHSSASGTSFLAGGVVQHG
jgi:hypothetical protein